MLYTLRIFIDFLTFNCFLPYVVSEQFVFLLHWTSRNTGFCTALGLYVRISHKAGLNTVYRVLQGVWGRVIKYEHM